MRALVLSVVLGIAILLPFAGCKRGERIKPVSKSKTPPAAPAPKTPKARPPTRKGLAGKVLKTLSAKSYTYLKLATSKGVKWAAVMKVAVKVGDQVVVQNPMVMRNFKSKSLGRTWKEIIFGTVRGKGRSGMSPHGKLGKPRMAKGMAGKSPHGKMGKLRKPGMPKGKAGHAMMKLKTKAKLSIKVAKAPGGRSVAEVFAQRAALKGKTVVVRGKVTKFNAGIMGKNWVHIQDGSGSAKAKNYDLTITTQGKAKVGDVVTFSGIVKTDQKLGAGYSYPVLVGKATIKK